MSVFLSPMIGAGAQFFSDDGLPLSGGKIYTYTAGTTTPQTTYTTSAGNVAWSNPIVLDAVGRITGSGEVWLTENVQYKFVLKTSDDVLIATFDNILGINDLSQGQINASQVNFTGFKNQIGTVEDLADDDGSDWIGFLQQGNLAVAMSAQDKMRLEFSVKDFGATGDGIFGTDGAINSGATTFTSASANFSSGDVGKLIKIGGAGLSNATLITTIAAVISPTSVQVTASASSTVTGANYTYGTDDTAAIIAAKNAALQITNSFRGGQTLTFPDGRYCFTDIGNLAISGFSVIALSANVWLESFRTTPGPAITLNGLLYDATYGSYRVTFGGAFGFNIRGNSNCSSIFYYNNTHWSDINLGNLRDGNIGVLGDKVGNPASPGAAVGTRFKGPAIGTHDLDSFDVTPAVAWYMTDTYACNIEYMQLEVSGSNAPTFGLYMTLSNGNVFTGGTVESCNYGGAWITSSANRNTFLGVHNEFNGSGPDWKIDGNYNVLIACSGVGTYSTFGSAANVINGDYNQLIGGEFNDLEISATADYTIVQSANLTVGTITNNSATTTFTSCNGVADRAPAPPGSGLTLGTGASNTGAPYLTAQSYRTRAGQVQVNGVVTCGTISGHPYTIATLPSDRFPTATISYAAYNLTTDTAIGLTINTSGQIQTRANVATGDVVSIFSPPFSPA